VAGLGARMAAEIGGTEAQKSGSGLCASLCGTVLLPLHDLAQPDLEGLARDVLERCGDRAALSKHEAHVKGAKKQEKKSVSMGGLESFSMSTPSAAQTKNHSLRFGLDAGTVQQSKMWPFGGEAPSSSSGGGGVREGRSSITAALFGATLGGNDESFDYEDVTDPTVLSAPICDICIVQRGDAVPPGYRRLAKTPKNKKANLNTGSGGTQLFLCILKDTKGDSSLLTTLCVIFPDRNEFVPPGFQVVKRDNSPCNLNSGTSAERIFLCYKKDKHGNPLTDLQIILPGKGEEPPKNFNLVDKSPSGRAANLNAGTGGGSIFLCYRQIFPRLSCLGNASEPPTAGGSRSTEQRGTGSAGGGSGEWGGERSASYQQHLISSRSTDSITSALSTVSLGDSERRGAGLAQILEGSSSKGDQDSTGPTATRGNRIRTETEESSYLEVSDALSGTAFLGILPSGGSQGPSTTSSPEMISAHKLTAASFAPISISQYDTSLFRLTEGKDDVASVDEETSTTDGGAADTDNVAPSSDELMLDRDRRKQVVVDSSGTVVHESHRKSLLALLSCLYLRQGNVADAVIGGLTSLLRDTDFFEADLGFLHLPGSLTMLDVTVEAVCDRVELCRESDFPKVLTFLQVLVKHSGGRLSPVSLQRVFKALTFMLHMCATRTAWMKDGLLMPLETDTGDVNAFKVLRDLVWAVVAQVETIEPAQSLPDDSMCPRQGGPGSLGLGSSSQDGADTPSLLRGFVLNFVEEVVDAVEVSRIAEATQLVLSKHSTSTSSSHFWQQISVLSRRLFSEYQHRCAFVTLCAVTKLAWHDVRNINAGTPMPRDLGGKMLALEPLLEFCVSAGERMRVSKIMGYMIRRLVVPCILYNVQFGLRDHRVFSKLMKLITALWKVWRSHVRIEFALLVEQVVIRVMQADILTIRPVYQMIVVQEVVTWFDQPHLLVEMFVNFDMDRKFVSHWNVFSYLIRAVCATARRVNVVTGAWDWRPRSESSDDVYGLSGTTVSIRSVHLQALEEVGRISKTLMDATGHAYLIMQDANFRDKTLGAGSGWEEDILEDYEYIPSPEAGRTEQQSRNSSPRNSLRSSVGGGSGGEVAGATSADSLDGGSGRHSHGAKKGAHTVKFRRAVHQEAEELLKEAIKIYEGNGSLRKAVRFLVDRNFMADTPQEIASFLRVYKNSFDPSAIGEFLGEGGRTPADVDYWSQIRFRYTRAVSFVEMDLEPALRLYLTGCGFRLPGEAQKVDRFVEVFVKVFWQDNSGTPHCPFSHPDTVHLVTYAIIMLNTDHHRANLSKTKARSKMTREQFVLNLRGADKDRDIDSEYLCRIFDNVQAEAIELAYEASEAPVPASGQVGAASSGVGGYSTSGVGGGSGASLASTSRGRHGSVFQTTEAPSALSMLTFRPTLTSQELSLQEEQKFFRDITRTLRDSEDLLRSLSPFTYRFQLTGVDTNISMDLVSFMYETVWFHFRAITDSLLQNKKRRQEPKAGSGPLGGQQADKQADKQDLYVTFIALDILCYSLTASIFLGLKVEAVTFADQLQQFIKDECADNPSLLGDDWLQDVRIGAPETSMETIAKIHTLLVRVKDCVQEAANREVTRAVAARIEKKANVLANNGFFVCEGDLAKRNRNGRFVTYRFFLFSDHLIYAHQGMTGEYKVHGQLHLTLMSVTDLVADNNKCSFYITHPTKSFAVVAESPSAKLTWLRDLQTTIQNCCKRAASDPAGRGRKQSFLNRIDSQVKMQIKEAGSLGSNSPTRESISSPRDPPADSQSTPTSDQPVRKSSASFALPSGSDSSPSPGGAEGRAPLASSPQPWPGL